MSEPRRIATLERELAVWRAKQPLLDRLADMLDVCEGVCPLTCAITEIQRLQESRDWWRDQVCNQDMAGGALDSIHRLLDSGGIPRGTFADDHVKNLVAMYNQRGREIARLRRALDAADIVLGSDDDAAVARIEDAAR